ncbi:MAG TPA: hypothetical protein PLI45_04560 [Candidatus Woesebacteria bacterium]|nr:hypothetical protein [Candidatus Woesebacteria bacterium]
MATKIITSIDSIPHSALWVTKEGKDIKPAVTGRLGAFLIGSKLKINLSVIGEHSCFTIDPNNPSKHIAKKTIGEGVYEKNITIIEGESVGLAPRWPNNIVCLDVADRHFSIGIQQQHGIFYLIVEEYVQTDEEYLPGQVKWFSALRGFGAVASTNPLFDYNIHCEGCPKRENGLRYLNSGEQITWKPEDEVDGDGSSTFIRRITKAELAS